VHLVSHLGGSVIHPGAIIDAMTNYGKKTKGSIKKKSLLGKLPVSSGVKGSRNRGFK
jgi:hypothetical protein